MICAECEGRGWIVVESSDGVSGARRCRCSRQRVRADRPPTPTELMMAALYLARVVDYFPKSDEGLVQVVADEMAEYVNTMNELDVLIKAAQVRLGRWSLRGLRELFCTMFEPKDGQRPDDTPEAGEMRSIEKVGREYFARLADYKRKMLSAGADSSPEPASESPGPRNRRELRGVLDGQNLCHQTLREAEERLTTDMKNAEPLRTPEERARLVADIRAQLEARAAARSKAGTSQ